ncbi:MAG: MBG domain-containing protein, partial [Verrucomicrobiota bacterium]
TDASLTVSAKAATIVANAKSRTYGDANPSLDAVVTGTINGDTLSYTLATTATAASAVGSYPITVAPGSNPNYTITPTGSSLTVSARAATIAANSKSRTYGDVNPSLDAVVSGTANGDSLNYTLATTAVAVSGVGSYPISVTLGSNPNYSVTPTAGSLTVSARAATVVANAKSRTYGEANPVLNATVVGLVNGDSLNYTLATTATPASGAGSYPITVAVGSNPNYSVTPTDSSLTVNAKAASVVANSKARTYGEANPTFDAVVTGTINGDVLSYTLATAATPASGAGSYPITVTLGSNPNYTVTPTAGVLTVGAKAATVVANAKSRTYGDSNPLFDAVVTGLINGDTLNYTLASTATVSSSVGSYPIAVTPGSNPNYTVTPTGSTLTISPRTASVVVSSKSKAYGDANPTLEALVTGLVNGDTLNYTLATTATATSGVGLYPITVTFGSNPNYNVTLTSGSLTVTTRAATVAARAKSKAYGDAVPALDALVTGAANGDSLNYTLATTATAASGVGSYPITVTLGNNPNYNLTATDGSLTVSPKVATVAANAKSRTYGEANPLLDAVVSGTVNGDILNYTLATAATAASGVGSYPITVTLGSNPNYSVSQTGNSLSVTARAASIVANSKSKTYGDANPVLDAVVSGLVSGDVLSYTLATTATATSGVGLYPIDVTFGSNPNYNVTIASSVLSVTPKAATIVVNSRSKTYGDVNPALDAVVTGAVSGDTLNYTLATAAITASGVGAYPITVSLGSNPNYSITPTAGTLTVNARAATIVANARSKTYGDANPALDATVTGTILGDVLNYTLATTATVQSGAGTHPITVTPGSNPNYAVTTTDSLLTVNVKAATIVANAKSRTYGEANPVLDAVVTGAVNGDSLNYTLATTATATSGIGSYPIAVTLGSNPNYNIVKTDSSLTVNVKTVTVVASSKSRVYGDANPVLDAVVTGAVIGDAVNYTLATTAILTSGIGSYPISVTLGSNPNYSVTPTGGMLTVNPRTATVVANSKTRSYGDANPVLDAIVTGLVSGDTINYTLSTTATATSGVGLYPINVTSGINPNYNVTLTSSALIINARAATVTANAKSKTYGQANPVLDAVVAGAVNGDTLSYTLATTATTASGAGTYPISVTPGSNPNYNVTPAGALLTVNAKAATVAANAKSRVYGDANPSLDAVVSGTINGDVLSYTLATTATIASGVGSYPITVTLGSNPNYTVTPTAASLTITAAELVVTAEAKAKTQGDADPSLTYTVAGLKLTDTGAGVLNGSLVRAAGEVVGVYAITQGTLVAGTNYSIRFVEGTLTINAAAQFVVSMGLKDATHVVLRWTATANARYRVQFTTALNGGQWSDLPGDPTVTGSTAEMTDTLTSGLRFYRVQQR